MIPALEHGVGGGPENEIRFPPLVLAPLRGVTVAAFRRVFAGALREAGFSAAVSPFVSAVSDEPPGGAALSDLSGPQPIELVPQVIGRRPSAVAAVLRAFKALGYKRADLNAGCPFPMVRRKGRGSGLLENPDLLARICEAGVETMGAGNFSVKVRLGVSDPFALERRVMPVLNGFPLASVAIHPRTAEQMYAGSVDMERYFAAAGVSRNPVIYNGDLFDAASPARPVECNEVSAGEVARAWAARYGAAAAPAAFMSGRGFVRSLGLRPDSGALALAYLEESAKELRGPAPVLGRMKELLSYWRDAGKWKRRWGAVKISRTLAELESAIAL